MPQITVNKDNDNATHNLIFDFPTSWEAMQHDASQSFYRKKYKQFADSKRVDIVAIDTFQHVLWLIEVKDYRAFPKRDKGDIYSIIAQKVKDTLSCLLVAAYQKGKNSFEYHAIRQEKIRIVFHLEQPRKPSKLYPQLIDWSNGRQKLKQTLRVVDPHPILCNMRI